MIILTMTKFYPCKMAALKDLLARMDLLITTHKSIIMVVTGHHQIYIIMTNFLIVLTPA